MHKLAIFATVLFLCSSTFIESQLDTSTPDKQALRSNGSISEGLAGAVTATDAAAGRGTTAGSSKPSTQSEFSGFEYQQQTVERGKGSLAPLLWHHIQQQGQPVRRRAGLLPQAAGFDQTLDLDQYDYEAAMLDDGPDGLDERQWDNSWAAQGTQDQPQGHQPSLLPTALADGVEMQQHPDTIAQQQQQHNPAVLLTPGPSNGTASRLAGAAVPSYAATTGAAESGGLSAGSAATVQTASAEQSVLPGLKVQVQSAQTGAAPKAIGRQQDSSIGHISGDQDDDDSPQARLSNHNDYNYPGGYEYDGYEAYGYDNYGYEDSYGYGHDGYEGYYDQYGYGDQYPYDQYGRNHGRGFHDYMEHLRVDKRPGALHCGVCCPDSNINVAASQLLDQLVPDETTPGAQVNTVTVVAGCPLADPRSVGYSVHCKHDNISNLQIGGYCQLNCTDPMDYLAVTPLNTGWTGGCADCDNSRTNCTYVAVNPPIDDGGSSEPYYRGTCTVTAVAECCKQVCKKKQHHHQHYQQPHYTYGYPYQGGSGARLAAADSATDGENQAGAGIEPVQKAQLSSSSSSSSMIQQQQQEGGVDPHGNAAASPGSKKKQAASRKQKGILGGQQQQAMQALENVGGSGEVYIKLGSMPSAGAGGIRRKRQGRYLGVVPVGSNNIRKGNVVDGTAGDFGESVQAVEPPTQESVYLGGRTAEAIYQDTGVQDSSSDSSSTPAVSTALPAKKKVHKRRAYMGPA